MPTDSCRLVTILAASRERLYDAWLDADDHAAFTGAPATSEPGVGGHHTAHGGYIKGRHVELTPGRRIVQSWRTTDFPSEAPDSRLELLFEARGDGSETTVTLIHTEIPEGQGAKYQSGWGELYFEPMRAYFAVAKVVSSAPAATKKRAAAKKKVAPKKRAALKTKLAAKKRPAPKRKAAPKKKVAAKKTAPKKTARKKAR